MAACCAGEGTPVCYTEDVGRHKRRRQDRGLDLSPRRRSPPTRFLYTTGRLTSEMIIKDGADGNSHPGLAFRALRAWGVDLARQVGLTLVGRARGENDSSRCRARSASFLRTRNPAFVEEEIRAPQAARGGDRDE